MDVTRKPNSFSKLMATKPKPVEASGQDLVRTEPLEEGSALPLVVRPGIDEVDLVSWARQNRERVEQLLWRHGGLLFRGFGLRTVPEFEQLALSVCPVLFGDYGDLPPEEAGGKVYRSTPYPADKTILFHNESSHLHRWPMKQFFFCLTAAQEGGETPIVDCREIYRRLPAGEVRRFEEKGLLYVRNFTESLDVSWQEFFRTDDRAEVERYCRNAGMELEWRENNGLQTRQRCPAVARHPRTGEPVFFNQIQLHHVSCLDPGVRDSLLALFGEDGLPRNVYYGDGTPIPDALVQEILATYWAASVAFPWQEGDVLFVDNMLAAHARNPFAGPRKIVVAMGEMFESSELVQ